jgi:hypothetical protein
MGSIVLCEKQILLYLIIASVMIHAGSPWNYH